MNPPLTYHTYNSVSSHFDASNNLCYIFLLCEIGKKFLENSNGQVNGIQNSRMISQYVYRRLRLFINVSYNVVEIKILFKIVISCSYRKIRTDQGHKTTAKNISSFLLTR